MLRVNVHEAGPQLSRLLEDVEAGERVLIVRTGEPVAVLTPYKTAARRRHLGLFVGQATIRDDFDELAKNIAEAFGPPQRHAPSPIQIQPIEDGKASGPMLEPGK